MVILRGQVGWMPRLVGGEKSRPYNDIFVSRKLRPLGLEIHYNTMSDIECQAEGPG
jgi:hypothetical protein